MDKQKLGQFISALDDKSIRTLQRLCNKALNHRHYERISKRSRRSYVSDKPHISMLKLISDDWSHLFDWADNKDEVCYVYVHSDPRSKWVKLSHELPSIVCPFYVGMGRDGRAYDKTNRSKFHKERLGCIMNSGFTMDDIVTIVRCDITELNARILESKLIYFFGCASSNYVPIGHDGRGARSLYGGRPCLINQQYERLPDGLLIEKIVNKRSSPDGSFIPQKKEVD